MYDQSPTKLGNTSTSQMTRIDHDVETVKQLSARIRHTTQRIVRHAQTLGYFEAPPTHGAMGQAPMPVISTLADVLRDLDRACDELSGALNLFD